MATLQAQFKIYLRFMLLMLVLSCQQACAVGIIKVEGPDVPLIKNPVVIDRAVSFEVCVPPELKNTGWNNIMNKKIKEVVQREFGIQAHPEALALDKPYFHFLFIQKTDSFHIASLVLSFITLSAIPGYGVDRTKIDIQFTARGANGGMVQGGYKYEYRDRYFLWLPFIFYPDIVGSINGGYMNEDKESLGLKLVLRRFIVDAAEKLHQQSITDKTADSLLILKCPAQ